MTRNITSTGTDSHLANRLQYLEQLVKELKAQLTRAQTQAVANTTKSASSEVRSPGVATGDSDSERWKGTSPTTNTDSVQKHFGRLVSQDASSSRYVSSGFWSRVNDELDGLGMDSLSLASDESKDLEDDTLPENTPSTQEAEQTPSERHSFLFGHCCLLHDLHDFHPLPSQIPFLVDIFAENVNFIFQAVHIPTIKKLVRGLRGNDMTHLTPANEALMFSIYYAAITAMEEDDVGFFHPPRYIVVHCCSNF